MRRENLRRGSLVGPWKLVKRLGSGGNGDVWRAVHADGRAAAVKVLRDLRRRARFRDEIEFLLDHDPGPCVLPPDRRVAAHVVVRTRLVRHADRHAAS